MSADRRLLFYILSVVGLFTCLWGLHGQMQIAALPAAFDPEELAYPVTVTGTFQDRAPDTIHAGRPAEVVFLVQGWERGAKVLIAQADGKARQVRLRAAHSLSHGIVTLISGLIFWAVCAFVFAPRTRDRIARGFFWITFLFGQAMMIGGIYFPGPNVWPGAVRGLLYILCLATITPLFVRVTLTFPKESMTIKRFPWVMPMLWIWAAGLILWQSIVYLRYFTAPTPEHGAALDWPKRVADGIMVIELIVGYIFMFRGMHKLELTRERAKAKWLLWGFVLGTTPYVFLRTFLALCGVASPLTPQVDRLFELAIPIAFVFAVVRYQLLAIDIIIRRSLIYGFLAAAMVVLFLVPGIGIGSRLMGVVSSATWILLLLIGLVAGVLFNPLRTLIGRLVDRLFFKLRFDHDQALRRLNRELELVAGQADLAAALLRTLDETLGPQKAGVIVQAEEEPCVVGDSPREGGLELLAEAKTDLLAAANSTSLPEVEAPHAIQTEFPLVQAIRHRDETLGLILLGPKRTERRYIETDLDLLRAVARAAAATLERIRLVQSVAAEARARRHLDEMNVLKNEFLARVAHDLRTPLAAIAWSTENLLDGVVGQLQERQAEYLRSIKASTGHLNRLVGNLLEISRLERGVLTLELEPVELALILREAMQIVQPLAAEKDVTCELSVADDAARIRGSAAKLVEVAMNLIDNAVKYAPAHSRIEISTGPGADGFEQFTIRDHGPGLGEGGTDTLFERFQQGAPSPHSQKHGFGLGLYIVRTYMELMGGRVTARNHAQGGALLQCELPRAKEE